MTEKSGRLIGQAEVIALATDGSSCTEGAVQEAIYLAQSCGAKLVALHVIPIDSELAMTARAISEVLREEISSHMDGIRKMAKDADVAFEAFVEESYQPENQACTFAPG